MIKSVVAASIDFNVTGTLYSIGTDTFRDDDWRLGILQQIKNNLLSGVCGDVTLLNSLQGSAWKVWEQSVCSLSFYFDRFSREIMQVFENCTIESVIIELPHNDCYQGV